MDLIPVKVLIVTVIFFIDVISTITPLCFRNCVGGKRNISRVTCLVSGIILGTAMIQLLSQAEEYDEYDYKPEPYFIHFVTCIGFILTLFMGWILNMVKSRYDYKRLKNTFEMVQTNTEALSGFDSEWSEKEDGNMDEKKEMVPDDVILFKKEMDGNISVIYLFLGITFIESTITGITVGVQQSEFPLLTLFIILVATDWIEAAVITFSLLNFSSKFSKKFIIGVGVFHASTIPIGCIIGVTISYFIPDYHLNGVIKILMAFISGIYLCIATVDMLGREMHSEIIIDGAIGPWTKVAYIAEKMMFLSFGFSLCILVAILSRI